MITSTEHLQTLNAYVPPPVARIAFQNPHRRLEGTWRRFHAVAIFADISGFTPLAEALALNGLQGAEELNTILNQVFEALISTIESHGGQVICFSGDALSLIWPCEPQDMTETAWRALQAAFAMQSTIAGFTIIPTSQGAFDLRMKVGMSAGELLEVHAGGELNRLEYILAGTPMANMTRAENLAVAGEIVVDGTIWQLTDGLDLDRARQMMAFANSHHTSMPKSYVFGEPAGSDFYRITHLWSRLPPTPLTYPEWSQLDAHAAAQVTATLYSYIPAAISNFFENGPESALAKLRPMTVCFVGISGIDYNCDAEAGLRLHNFLRDAQKVIYHYEGSINKLDVGDKGSVLLVLFGAPPFYHQDDELRAVGCALDLGQVAVRHRLAVRIGLAAGPLFLGPLGATQRREYTVIGDTVNLAARLMQNAEVGQVLIDESIQRKARRFLSYQDLGQIQIKGRTEPRHAFLVLAVNEQAQQTSMMSYPFGNNDLEMTPLASPAQVSYS